jgi:hypothetical protein
MPGLGQPWAGHPPRILFANRMAREMLDARDGLWLEAGLLSASDMNHGRTLQGFIASCAAGTNVTGRGGDMPLRRESGRMPLDVQVTPFQREHAVGQYPLAPKLPVAIVLISDPESETRRRSEDIGDVRFLPLRNPTRVFCLRPRSPI